MLAMAETQDLFARARNQYPADFEAFWQSYPARPGNPKQSACKKWHEWTAKGCDPQTIIDGARAYREYCDAVGSTGTTFCMMAKTFLGPDAHFLEDWTPPDQSDKRAGEAWDEAIRAASQSADARKQWMAAHPELKPAVDAVGGLKQIGLMNEWQLKEAKTKFMEALG